jgi:hypothetical protein
LTLYLITTAEGMPLAWCLADPQLGEREVAEEFFGHARDHGALREGMVVLADKGLSGKELERFAADQIGVLLVHPDRADATQRRYGNLAGMRQWIEARSPRRAGLGRVLCCFYFGQIGCHVGVVWRE